MSMQKVFCLFFSEKEGSSFSKEQSKELFSLLKNDRGTIRIPRQSLLYLASRRACNQEE